MRPLRSALPRSLQKTRGPRRATRPSYWFPTLRLPRARAGGVAAEHALGGDRRRAGGEAAEHLRVGAPPSDVEVQEELVRRGAHADRVQLLRALEVEPLVNGVLRE